MIRICSRYIALVSVDPASFIRVIFQSLFFVWLFAVTVLRISEVDHDGGWLLPDLVILLGFLLYPSHRLSEIPLDSF